ncbi:YlbF family regulator [Sporolituus thermophilus]|uniref:Control of competence regulator ComK, YlbF/YmcA n=1 Tax=Sporolituus thermophilus DSM 23256 TaxID=1123285 RepID=A0A1G7HQ43_9FIRM|nr:YlbF family regulator [Sporolituus thermophilus]SDF02541.1 Control of competence regulator ComK, YlbF/YmcA [Sporolituus thermophilus DSM 23256]
MLENKAKEIVEELKKTNEFKALKQAKDTLERNSQLKRRVEQFSLDHAKAYQRTDGGGKFPIEELERRFNELMQVPEIAAYFKAGQKFDNVVMKLHELIDELLEQALAGSNR